MAAPRFRKREIRLAIAATILLEQLDEFGKDLDGWLEAERVLIEVLRKSLRPYRRVTSWQ